MRFCLYDIKSQLEEKRGTLTLKHVKKTIINMQLQFSHNSQSIKNKKNCAFTYWHKKFTNSYCEVLDNYCFSSFFN